MIVVDSSALVAILEQDPDGDRFLQIIREEPRRFVSAVTIYETGIVIGARRGWDAVTNVMALIDALSVEIVPFAEPYVSAALEAYGRYGKGVHPKARLNLGDCVAYALAKSLDAPLLFKGSDFAQTDVTVRA